MGALALAGFPDGANDAERLGSAHGPEAACDLQFDFDVGRGGLVMGTVYQRGGRVSSYRCSK